LHKVFFSLVDASKIENPRQVLGDLDLLGKIPCCPSHPGETSSDGAHAFTPRKDEI
jgi:hypothetical protein